jgi:hypothetical protein
MIDARRVAAVAAVVCAVLMTGAERADAQAPWFGVSLPPGFEAHTSPLILGGDYGPRPAFVPPGEERFTELSGASIWEDLSRIVQFSVESRASREVGDGQLWGRITGLPSGEATMTWAAERLEAAGVPRVERQWFDQQAGAALWLPLSWEVTVLGDAAFGGGTRDVVLESAMPANAADIPASGLVAPLVFVGTARAAELAYHPSCLMRNLMRFLCLCL